MTHHQFVVDQGKSLKSLSKHSALLGHVIDPKNIKSYNAKLNLLNILLLKAKTFEYDKYQPWPLKLITQVNVPFQTHVIATINVQAL